MRKTTKKDDEAHDVLYFSNMHVSLLSDSAHSGRLCSPLLQRAKERRRSLVHSIFGHLRSVAALVFSRTTLRTLRGRVAPSRREPSERPPPVLPPISTKDSSSLCRRPWPLLIVSAFALLRSSPLWYSCNSCLCSGLSGLAFLWPLPLAALSRDSLFCRRCNMAPRRSLERAICASRTFCFCSSVLSPGTLGGPLDALAMASSR